MAAAKVIGYAVFDAGTGVIEGPVYSDKKAAEIHLGSLVGRTGEYPERKISVVKLVDEG